MEFREKALYHQIYPAKLLTDWGTAMLAAYLLWQHQLVIALLVALVPAVAASALVVRYADLESYKASAFGRDIARYMTPTMQLARLVGLAAFWAAAWYHAVLLVAAGLIIVVAAWARDFLWRG